MATAKPATVLNNLIERLEVIQAKPSISDLDIKRLTRDAEALKNSEVEGYYMVLGMVASVAGKPDDVILNFERALRLRCDHQVLRNYMVALGLVGAVTKLAEVCKQHLRSFRDDVAFQKQLWFSLLKAGAIASAARLVSSWIPDNVNIDQIDRNTGEGLKVYWGTIEPHLRLSVGRSLSFLHWEERTGVSEDEIVRAVEIFCKGITGVKYEYAWRATYLMDDTIPTFSYGLDLEADAEVASKIEREAFGRLALTENAAIEHGWLIIGVDAVPREFDAVPRESTAEFKRIA